MLGRPKAHEAGIVLLALFFFVLRSVLLLITMRGIEVILLTEYAVLRPRRTLCWGASSETSVSV